MNFWNKICGVALVILLTSHGVRAQSQFTPTFLSGAPHPVDSLTRRSGDSKPFFFHTTSIYTPLSLTPVSKDYLVHDYGFFCREELHFEERTRIPLRVRLGSVEACDHYEGKDR
jgi:hypothetical protein